MPDPLPRSCPQRSSKAGDVHPDCIDDLARNAGGWADLPSIARDPWDEVARQQDIHDAAMTIVDTARRALLVLANRSRAHRRMVTCDQEDWGTTITDGFDDLVGDTFGCLPEAIARARRELGGRRSPL